MSWALGDGDRTGTDDATRVGILPRVSWAPAPLKKAPGMGGRGAGVPKPEEHSGSLRETDRSRPPQSSMGLEPCVTFLQSVYFLCVCFGCLQVKLLK